MLLKKKWKQNPKWKKIPQKNKKIMSRLNRVCSFLFYIYI